MGDRGYTLVELVVVIAILAILAMILLPHMKGYLDWANGKIWEAEQDMEDRELAAQRVLSDGMPQETVPEETPPREPTEAETVPTIPPVPTVHTCRDRDKDCLCDEEGCGKILHEEVRFKENGNCQKCGIHFVHRGLEDGICDICMWDAYTGAAHVCSWEAGACRCRCGQSRCDHGSTGVDPCAVCGRYNTQEEPCPNCR